MRISDKFTKACLLFLLLFTPLAFGAVHPWAYSLMEGVVALMGLVWAWKIWSRRKVPAGNVRMSAWPYALPLGLFVAYVMFQLVPLPPTVLQAISPSTYEIYTQALPGWPERTPYVEFQEVRPREPTDALALEEAGKPGMGETKVGSESPYAVDRTPYTVPEPRALSVESRPWLPLSVAPLLTRADLLKFSTYTLLFFLVLFYPAPGAARDPGHRLTYELDFVRPLLYTVLVVAFLVASLGFLNLFTWNGKVLWFFVPHDASGGGAGLRAAAPFIAPPSFANYLAMTLPLTVMVTVWPSVLTPRPLGAGFRILCGFAGFVLFCGILLSLSRAGWAAAMLGIGVLVFLIRIAGGKQSSIVRTPLRRLASSSLVGVCLLFVALVFVGPRGQENLDRRLQKTVDGPTSLEGRYAVWRNSLEMVRDFPVFGVGLGAWPDLFPRYQGSALDGFYRETHNDYLELLTETGVVGSILLVSFFAVSLIRLFRYFFSLEPQVVPIVGALVGGMSAMAFHEIFDFNLQIPANAVLFTIFLAVSLRLSTLIRTPSLEPRTSSAASHRFTPLLGSLTLASVSVLLFTKAFSQPMAAYPYYLRKSTSVEDALDQIYWHPANAEAHRTLFDAVAENRDIAWQLDELERILWLAPGKTETRDAYAARLLLQGRTEEALYEVTRSVAESPTVNDHFYLSRTIAPTLFPREQEAVIFGFRRAIEESHPVAFDNLVEFYRRTERFADLGYLYAEAADRAADEGEKAEYLFRAADAALEAEQLVRAEDFLLEAARLKPDPTAVFVKLIEQLYNRRGDLQAAARATVEGIRRGADPLALQVSLAVAAQANGEHEVASEAVRRVLSNGSNGRRTPIERYRSYVRLADVAESMGDDDLQEQALEKAIELQPNSYGALVEVARMHAARKDYNKAAFYYRKAIRANRTSANAYAALAHIEEERFRFAKAAEAYAKAVQLAPTNKGLQRRYESFKARVAEGKKND